MKIELAGVIACAILSWPLLGQGGFGGPGVYEIANVNSGKVVDLDRNDQTTVIQFSSRGTDNQTWEIRPARDGFFFLRNAMNGYALDAGGGRNSEPVRGVPFNGGPSQQWRFDQGRDGNALIVSRLGRALDIPDGTSRDGAHIQLFDINDGSNQRFAFRQVSGGRRGGNWDRRGWDDGGGRVGAGSITCSSNNGERVYCEADTRNGVLLVQQISGTPCREGSTWGFDQRGIWVDRGCRAEFTLNAARGGDRGDRGDTIACSSDNGKRVYCNADTRGRQVQLVRQISGSPCRQGETWGWDGRGIWVDRGCRAEFVISRGR